MYKGALKIVERFVYLYQELYGLIVITASNVTVATIENLFLLHNNCWKPVKGAVCTLGNGTSEPFCPLASRY